MKVLKVKKFDPLPGTEWAPSSYPGDGAYETKVGLFIIVNGTIQVGSSPALSLLVEMPEKENAGNSSDSISGDTFLKALAIAQDPMLARDLLK